MTTDPALIQKLLAVFDERIAYHDGQSNEADAIGAPGLIVDTHDAIRDELLLARSRVLKLVEAA